MDLWTTEDEFKFKLNLEIVLRSRKIPDSFFDESPIFFVYNIKNIKKSKYFIAKLNESIYLP